MDYRIPDEKGDLKTIRLTRSGVSAIDDCLSFLQAGNMIQRLWINQISIQQSSGPEISQQIVLMKRIYESAAGVLCWLGPESKSSGMAMEWIDTFNAISRSDVFKLLDINNQALPEDKLAAKLAIFGEDEHAWQTTEWQAVRKLLRRDYFGRCWILQECTSQATQATANKCFCICGSSRVSLSALIHVGTLLYKSEMVRTKYNLMPPNPTSQGSTGAGFHLVADFYSHRRFFSLYTFIDLLHLIRRSECEDARDKVMCMASFADPSELPQSPFYLDRSLSWGDLYTTLATWSMTQTRNLDILSFVSPQSEWDARCPSWVPNWFTSECPEPLTRLTNKLQRTKCARLYQASSSLFEELDVAKPWPIAASFLQVCGTRVTQVGGVYDRDQLRQQTFLDKICPLNQKSLQRVATFTAIADTKAQDILSPVAITCYYRLARPSIRLQGWHEREAYSSGSRSVSSVMPKARWQHLQLGRKFFVTSETPDQEAYLLGLGPQNMVAGDEIWMLKGGKVLYALRRVADVKVKNTLVIRTDGAQHHERSACAPQPTYRFLGEVFMLSLMDGEIIEMMGKHPAFAKAPRPSLLKDLSDEFSEIHLV